MDIKPAQNAIRRRLIAPNEELNIAEPLLPWSSNNQETVNKKNYLLKGYKFRWPWSIAFIFFWLMLYNFLAIELFHHLPKSLTLKDESKYSDHFIAERAEIYLHGLVKFGKRVTGSLANEKYAVEYLKNCIENLKASDPLHYNVEIDIQVHRGSYVHWDMVNMYRDIQNVVVKLSHKQTNSSNYLLVNSHFDTVPNGPGAGDDGVMVAVMLEVLRVLMKSKQILRHPVIFLFNGAEENPLQGSHAFITGHKWARHVKAVINLDSAGNGGREILFQSGPHHPWLMKHYSHAVKHPYASTVGEEMFQSGIIPSDTDFRIFRDYGKIPGLDMAHQYNGYVYHTTYDRANIIPRGTLQNTGDNILALIRSIGNSFELENTKDYAEGHTVFFDVLGLFLIFYTENTGIMINVFVSLLALAACAYSIQAIAYNTRNTSILKLLMHLGIVQILSVILAAALCFCLAIFMDTLKVPLSWFTNSWLILGQYYSLLCFALTMGPALYFHLTKDHVVPLSYRLQLLLHSHCLLLVMVLMCLTVSKIRTAFLPMMAVLCYTLSIIINLISQLYKTAVLWLIPHIICCIPVYLILCYMVHGLFVAFIPMTGRFGANVNPDLIICGFTVLSGILITGFLMPVLNTFDKPKTIISLFLIITMACVLLAFTPIGFPYRPETNVQRFSVIHTQRILRDMMNNIRKEETGYLVLPQDRRSYTIQGQVLNVSLAKSLEEDCDTEMLCGLPLYNHRWHKARASCKWIPAGKPQFDRKPELIPIKLEYINDTFSIYRLQLLGPEHMGIFIRPLTNVTIHDWSFNKAPLQNGWLAPYFIYFSKGINVHESLDIVLEIKATSGNRLNVPAVEIGIAGHWTFQDSLKTKDFQKFLGSFPEYADVGSWPASYDTWYY